MTVPGGDLSVVGMNPSSSEMNGYHTRDFPFSVSQAALQQGAPGSCSVSHDDDEALLHQKVPSTRISSSLLPCFGNALGTEAVSSFVNQSDINQEIIKTFLWL